MKEAVSRESVVVTMCDGLLCVSMSVCEEQRSGVGCAELRDLVRRC